MQQGTRLQYLQLTRMTIPQVAHHVGRGRQHAASLVVVSLFRQLVDDQHACLLHLYLAEAGTQRVQPLTHQYLDRIALGGIGCHGRRQQMAGVGIQLLVTP